MIHLTKDIISTITEGMEIEAEGLIPILGNRKTILSCSLVKRHKTKIMYVEFELKYLGVRLGTYGFRPGDIKECD